MSLLGNFCYHKDMKVTARKVENYIDALDGGIRDDIMQLHKLISAHMPNLAPKMWEGVFWGVNIDELLKLIDESYLQLRNDGSA